MRPQPLPLRAAVVGLAAALGALGLVAAPAAADHTPVPATVTLVGTLQSKLGCPGDWQPECAATHLTEDPGSPGVFTGTFEVPAGAWEVKAALDDSWDESYGAAGGAGNLPLTAPGGPVTFTYDHSTHLLSTDLVAAIGAGASAQWVRSDLLAWDVSSIPGATELRLHAAPRGGLTEASLEPPTAGIPLHPVAGGLPPGVLRQFPQLAGYEAFDFGPETLVSVRGLLRGQLVVAAYDADGALVAQTGVQLPGVLDDEYAGARTRELGVTWRRGRPTLSVWAPTAKRVDLDLDPAGRRPGRTVAMHRDDDGVWSVAGRRGWRGATYRYAVKVYVPSLDDVVTNRVTDPYSVALTTNSRRSVVVDLDAPALAPRGWDHLRKPRLDRPEDSTVYELHVRDFSISDTTVPARHRGTYLAFGDRHSDGMRHLRRMARAGLTTVHLLPVNDIATIEERDRRRSEPACDLASFGPDSEQQQECVAAVADTDGFNWGYDPLHYTTPEGSYSSRPDGPARTRQFRTMVTGLNRAGLLAVMDVVYNHTPAAGQDPKSVLDQVVPGYYQRLSATGALETSTCCANTATEHAMMEKLMVDSVLTWAREYKVDGFRFDLMGHQPKAAMVRLRRALDRLTVRKDGVDGSQVYLYGEGWNFGEVADGARFEQATQPNMAGTGIGTFNDRLRDAVRGGGPFDADPRIQGFASGLYTDPNGADVNGTEQQQRDRLLLSQDQIKVGLTGNLRDYELTDRFGEVVTGAEVDYNGSPTGYTADPQEAVTYVEAHDNETLFDALAYKLPQATSMEDRIRMQTLALSTTALGQGVSFWHAGGDALRSKSLDRNSYNSGDWFNVLDWSRRTNGFGRGLPPAADNESKWPFMAPLLADPALQPTPAEIRSAERRALDLLAVRQSTRLFHLGTARLVQRKVGFPDGGPGQTPGVIVMTIDDRPGRDLDPLLDEVVVVFNAGDTATSQRVPGTAGRAFRLHPEQRHGADPVVGQSTYDAASGTFEVPARTVAVFVQRH